MITVEEAVLQAEEKDFSEGGHDHRYWD